jgi:hypothetical protein
VNPLDRWNVISIAPVTPATGDKHAECDGLAQGSLQVLRVRDNVKSFAGKATASYAWPS